MYDRCNYASLRVARCKTAAIDDQTAAVGDSAASAVTFRGHEKIDVDKFQSRINLN